MKIRYFFAAIIICAMGCKENSKHTYYKLLNDNFLKFVDTNAYKTGRLIQIPNDTINLSNLNKICILADTTLHMPPELKKSVLIAVRSANLKDFEELVLNGLDMTLSTIDLTIIKKTGKFRLFVSDKMTGTECDKIAGKITFYKPFISNKNALIVIAISESSKSGYTNAFLFEKKNKVWKNFKVFEIERW